MHEVKLRRGFYFFLDILGKEKLVVLRDIFLFSGIVIYHETIQNKISDFLVSPGSLVASYRDKLCVQKEDILSQVRK
jgi:hypothetical protein